MQTQELIEELEANCSPVHRLRHPAVRAVAWSAISLFYIAVTVWAVGLRPDIGARFGDWQFATESGAALLTSMMAAAAAFCAGCPGRPVWERFAPIPFLMLWLAGLGEGCWSDWIKSGAAGLAVRPDFMCFVAILMIGALPFMLIFTMVRRGSPIAPMSTMGLAALAAASLAAFAFRLLPRQDTNVMVLIWQFGSTVALAAIAALLGRFFLRWTTRDEALAAFRRIGR